MKTLYLSICALLLTGGLNAQYFSDDFEPAGGTLTQNNAWTTQVVMASTSGYDWFLDDFGGDAYAKVSNYNGTTMSNEVMETWLISPVVNLGAATQPILKFNNVKRFPGTDLIVNISTDYDGTSAPSTATWQDITSLCTMDANDGSWSFVASGDVDLTSTLATLGSPSTTYLAFRYQGGSADGSTYQIDDVIIQEGTSTTPTVSIFDIQNSAGASPYDGQIVNTAGIVTAVVNNGGDVGYFIQSGSGPFTGVYVDDAVNTPSRGDSVEITGSVEEDFSFTRLTSVTSYNVATTGNPEPAAATVTTADVNTEDYEGVLVQATSAECTDPSAGFGQWKIYDNATDTCLVDDIIYSFTPALGNNYDVTGPVWYSFSEYKILPRDAADVVGAALAHTVYNIQYTTDAGGFSPLNGANVTGVKGIVVAESSGAFDPDDRGYWIQDGSGAWHGVFVWDTVNMPAIGDSLLIDGNVNENFNQTIIRNVSSYTVLNTGNTLPVAPTVSTADINQEMYEGVLMNVTNANCTNPSLGFGQWEVNDGSGAMIIDDVIYEYPSPTAGLYYDVTGVIYYTFSEYKMLPRASVDVQVVSSIDEIIALTNVYPNPADEVVNFTSKVNGRVELIDISGKIVLRSDVVEGLNRLDVSNLTTGIYMLRLQEYGSIVKISVK